jgi:FkbM family methyltransferase
MDSRSSLPAAAPKLELIPIQLGFEMVADPSDYVSKLLLQDAIYEAPETDLVTRILRVGDTCIDAGCQIGYYSCLLAKLIGEKGRVYSFDANPQACLSTRRNLGLNGFSFSDVVHAALADTEGELSFHISTDDQTGLSSLGAIPTSKETISVPSLRLDRFVKERGIERVRLLKIDVEGAEEIVLRGLGSLLSSHIIDYILVECFDERLRLLGTSSERVAHVLRSAGYTPWEYGARSVAGWSEATEIRSRGDCNYLFASPSVARDVPQISLAPVLHLAQIQKAQALSRVNELQRLMEELKRSKDDLERSKESLEQNAGKLHDDIDWLLESIKAHEQESAGLAAAKRNLEIVLSQIHCSVSWRMLNQWRKVRNRLAPEQSWHRRLYDSILGTLRGSS